ncbi:hypothetical protein BC351_10285 [Paenibacillus ferrarius]|uniref:Phage tail-like C-terminal domain-containing protein n=1 Tax=Paenibacillus ferrarius TaxID=1469647 RepID=A0A1V4H9B2_9BACL|nr:hypothetical protein BC351_10285 [Paenibacillus ferrarius]
MATWNYLAAYKGFYTSPDIAINLDGDGVISKITWNATVPLGTSLQVQTNVSFDNGFNWEGWKFAIHGGSVPDIYANTPLYQAKIKYRFIAETTHKTITPTIESIGFYFEPVITYNNKGDLNVKPEIWIDKIGNGDFTIINTSKGNDEFKFTNLIDLESLYVNSEREEIETSLPNTYRYKDFNDNHLSFPYGVNILRIKGNAKIRFKSEYVVKQG